MADFEFVFNSTKHYMIPPDQIEVKLSSPDKKLVVGGDEIDLVNNGIVGLWLGQGSATIGGFGEDQEFNEVFVIDMAKTKSKFFITRNGGGLGISDLRTGSACVLRGYYFDLQGSPIGLKFSGDNNNLSIYYPKESFITKLDLC